MKVPPGALGQDEDGRLSDILGMLLYPMERASPDTERLRVELYGGSSTTESPKWVQFLAECGPVDLTTQGQPSQ